VSDLLAKISDPLRKWAHRVLKSLYRPFFLPEIAKIYN
jgi:hypothetical protein